MNIVNELRTPLTHTHAPWPVPHVPCPMLYAYSTYYYMYSITISQLFSENVNIETLPCDVKQQNSNKKEITNKEQCNNERDERDELVE